jgi:hypothetical protein
MLQEEKQQEAAAAEKKNAVLQTLCKKLQAEKKALMQQLSQYVIHPSLILMTNARRQVTLS